jgi:hypothetical protein
LTIGDSPTLAELADRLTRVEDELAIMRLLAAYGPAVDAGESAAAAALWTEDGAYDVGGQSRVVGREELTALYDGQQHQGIIAGGSGHLTSSPTITLSQDTATAVAYSLVCRRAENGFFIWRLSANRWSLVRTAHGWRTKERMNRVLDGGIAARDLLREAVQ